MEQKDKNVIAETYAGAMASVIENDKEGLVKKIIHEEQEFQAEKQNLSPESKKNKLFMFISFFLIILALATLTYFSFFMKDTSIVSVEQQFVPLIFNDKSSFLEVSGFKKDEIVQIISNEAKNTDVKNGGIEGIYLTENKQNVGLRRFLNLIKSTFTPSENTLFVSNNFLLGVVNSDTKNFFILLKVRSTSDIFDSLRAWEEKVFSETNKFWGTDLTVDTKYLLTKSFEDGVIENKNARILYDKDGKIVLMYIFADNNSVIITNSQKATHEIMLRLVSGKKGN